MLLVKKKKERHGGKIKDKNHKVVGGTLGINHGRLKKKSVAFGGDVCVCVCSCVSVYCGGKINCTLRQK